MGFFERPDPRLVQSADPTPAAAVARALGRHALALLVCFLAIAGAYAANVGIGLHATAVTRGTVAIPGLDAPVSIVRDRRDVPHIRAADAHDLYFAEGFVEGSDRLFQLDLSRRYAYGRLAEVLGSKALPYDIAQRAVDIDGIARRQLRALGPRDRGALVAFSDGVNAAAATQPLPVEFRILLYRPERWTPKDSLAISIVASLELADSWHDIFARDAVWRRAGRRCYDSVYPLSDARYDVSVDGAAAKRRISAARSGCDDSDLAARPARPAIGSNAWAAGAAHTRDGDALLANDPHIDLTVPGIWYLIDAESPQLHAAGAAIPGIPGVALGHNDRLAWASTNASMTTTSLFEVRKLPRGKWVTERFGVRFARDAHVRFFRTAREFSVPDENRPSAIALVRWPIYSESHSTIATELAIDRARSVTEALAVLARYRGSPQGFILADRSGAVAYHVAGIVPDDPAWGRYVHPARALPETFAAVPFVALPARQPSRDAILVSANNKPYRPSYPYRLSAQFQPPYRAFRIAQLMRAQPRYDAAYFDRMQLDTLSPIDLEFARDVLRLARADSEDERNGDAIALLAHWDGRYRPASRAAALEHTLRQSLFEGDTAFTTRLRELRGQLQAPMGFDRDVDGTLSALAFDRIGAWQVAGGTRIEHFLAPMHFGFLDGGWLPGAGDEFTIHLQEPGFAQGFRAVWDVGHWNRGGIAIPSGESGERGSGHYTDLTRAWIAGTLAPLPFGRAAVARNASATLVLNPYTKDRSAADTAAAPGSAAFVGGAVKLAVDRNHGGLRIGAVAAARKAVEHALVPAFVDCKDSTVAACAAADSRSVEHTL